MRFARCGFIDRRLGGVVLFAAWSAALPAQGQQLAGPPATMTLLPLAAADTATPQARTGTINRVKLMATEITVGASAWGGNFGGPGRSTVATLLVNVRQRFGDLRIDATLPWMRVRSPTTIFAGIDGTPLVLASAVPMTTRRRDGLGDVTLGASWLALNQADAAVDIDLSARIKLPTASDSSGLSTGRTDYAVAVEISRTMGQVTPIASVGYRVFGDPRGWDVRDGVATSIGASIALPAGAVVLVSYDFSERTSRFIRPSHALVAGASAPIGRSLRLTAFASGGLSSGAADVSVGAAITFALS